MLISNFIFPKVYFKLKPKYLSIHDYHQIMEYQSLYYSTSELYRIKSMRVVKKMMKFQLENQHLDRNCNDDKERAIIKLLIISRVR